MELRFMTYVIAFYKGEAARGERTGLPAVRLETQSSNVPACLFYERYGFKLGGFDRYLYGAIKPDVKSETRFYSGIFIPTGDTAKRAVRGL